MGFTTEGVGVLTESDCLRDALTLREYPAAEYEGLPPYNFSIVYYGLRDYAKTFTWLSRAYDARDPLLAAFINCEPFWEPLRSDKRFLSLLQRMNLFSEDYVGDRE